MLEMGNILLLPLTTEWGAFFTPIKVDVNPFLILYQWWLVLNTLGGLQTNLTPPAPETN